MKRRRPPTEEEQSWERLKTNFSMIKTNIEFLWNGVLTDKDRAFLASCNIKPHC